MSKALADVLNERKRQQAVEGWTPEHDDGHINGEIALAASCYAQYAHKKPIAPAMPFNWPWEPQWFKQQGARRDLVKAGALIVAEIERIDRFTGVEKRLPDSIDQAFNCWWNEEAQAELRTSCAEGWARKIWEASRSTIAIKTPDLSGDGENDTEYTEGVNDGIRQCDRAIINAGLKVLV